jgi:hypothetical protein
MAKKAEMWVSAVLYTLIALVAMMLILEAGTPILQRMKDKTTFARTKDMMTSLDKQIQDVAAEGAGSQRVVPVELREGQMIIADNKIKWEFETATKIIEPRTKQDLGNLVISSDTTVTAWDNGTYYLLENDYLIVNISKYGNSSTWVPINTSEIINSINFKETDSTLSGVFSFVVNQNETTADGNGFTSLMEQGTELPRAIVVTHMNTTAAEYDLRLTLESKADFIIVKVVMS